MNSDNRPLAQTPPDGCADAHTLSVLEFPQVLERAASLAQSRLGASLVRALMPCPHLPTVQRRQRRLSQLRDVLSLQPWPSLAGLEDLSPLLNRLAVSGAFLVPEELEVVADFLGAVSRAASFLDPTEGVHDELFRLRNLMTPLPQAVRRIGEVVGPGHTVKSKASPELARLRKDLARSRERLNSRLSNIMGRPEYSGVFSDQVVTQRADRFVLPVRTDAKGRVQGIIHDTSGTGATCFMEPLEAVEDNNRLALLRRQEKEEQERILKELAEQLAGQIPVLRENQQALAKLDCLLAQAAFGQRLEAVEPEFSQNFATELLRARHPLLAWRSLKAKGRAVPIDVFQGPETSVLVLSGANAGGKTVSVKTLGLLCLMAASGLHIPCAQGSRLPLFGRIFCEVGDDQDLDRDLSTFTAHAGRLAWIVRHAGADSLVLIDELGNGTDPNEGAALAMAVLEQLMQQKARVLCTTHFHRLKAFAALTPGVQNVSVAFDTATGRPSYKLRYGAPGFSDALAVSRSLGFAPQVIDRAQKYLDQGERQTVALLRQAQNERQQAAAERESAHADRLSAAQERREAKDLLLKARKERSGALAEGKRRVREVARRLEERLNGLLEQVTQDQEKDESPRPGRIKQDIYQAQREALAEVEQVVEVPPLPTEHDGTGVFALKQGNGVRLVSLNQSGVLLEQPTPEAETVAVAVGERGVRVVVPTGDLAPLPSAAAPKPPQPRQTLVQAEAGDGLDLNLVGMTVDEALPLVDKALDRAILAGRNNLRVIHGVGTGRLRQAVRSFLEEHPYVAATRSENARQGGVGVTVADLRE